MNKEYIGDGVYAQVDGDDLILTTENGVSVQNRIVFEIEHIMPLEDYIRRYKELFA